MNPTKIVQQAFDQSIDAISSAKTLDQRITSAADKMLSCFAGGGKIPRLHVYVPVDPALMVASLGEKADKAKIERDLADFVSRAATAGMEVEFSPEGYSRMAENFDFTTDLVCEVGLKW